MICFYPGCGHFATHWILRQLPPDYRPNPDVRAYCDGHRFRTIDAAIAALHAPVVHAEFVEIDRDAWTSTA